MTFYNSSQPINIKSNYSEFDVTEFLIKMPTGRQMNSGSLRLNGFLKLFKVSTTGAVVGISGTEGLMFDQYTGIHSLFRNTNTTINNRTIESLQNYPRYVAMMSQHDFSPEGLITSSLSAPELKGCLNTKFLQGTSQLKGVPFSMKPMIAINKSSDDLAQSKFQEIKVMFQLGSAVESMYISGGVPTADIFSVQYQLSDLQLSWVESPEVPATVSTPVILNTVSNMVQTMTGLNSNIQVVSSTPYDAISISFMRQSSIKSLKFNNMLSEYVPAISRCEFLVNGISAPLSYAITTPCYQDIALNYYKSLSSSGNAIWRNQSGIKNSIMNRFLNENGSFGIGTALPSSINDKLQVAITIDDGVDDAFNPSTNPIDCFIFVNGFLSI